MSLRVAVAGVGIAGGWYADILRQTEGATLVAALRDKGGDTASIAQAWNTPCFTNWQDLLEQARPDALIIATPSGLHHAQAKAALQAGLHVLLEKPMALRVKEARELVQLAQHKNLRLGVVFQRRTDPVYQAVKQALDSGALGQPVLLSITMPYYRSDAYYASAAWRGTWALDGGGILMNQGIHLADVAVWWLGRARQVAAFATTLAHPIEVEDTLTLCVTFTSGALGSISGTTASAPGSAHTLELCGTKGSLRIEGESVVRWDVQGLDKPESENIFSSASDPRQTYLGGHRRIVQDFVTAVHQERDPVVSGAEGVKSLELVQAAYESFKNQTIIEVS